MSAPSPKRQRLPGSFSPGSPPYHLAAKGATGTAKPLAVQPQTPVSPSNMSSTGTGNSNPTSPTHPSISSGPSSGSVGTHHSTQTSATTALPTPTGSTKGRSLSINDEDMPMTDVASVPLAPPAASQDTAMTDSDSHIRTDHDRENDNDTQMKDLEEVPERLDPKAEPFYYILEEPHPKSNPHPSQDLISMYNLKSIATSVARRDPTTGDKINKIRKSYEGKIKTLGISGRNKPTIHPDELRSILSIPDDAWQATQVSTRDVKKGLSASLEAKLDRALKTNPGKLPPEEADKWKSMLAVDEPLKPKPGPADAKKPGPGGVQTSAASNAARASVPPNISTAGHGTAEIARPQRTGKKRRYDDASFEGYAEGLNDEDAGYSSPEEKLAAVSAAKKRRKKVRNDDETHPAEEAIKVGPSIASSSFSPGVAGSSVSGVGGGGGEGSGVGAGSETKKRKHFKLNTRAL